MIRTLECTLRDGGYINNWCFSTKLVNNYFNLMEKLNIDFVEIGFINNYNEYRNNLTTNLRHLDKKFIEEIKNNYSFKTVVMGDYGNINMDLLKQKINVDLIRIVFHKKDMENALKDIEYIKNLGYNVCANPMAISNYNNDERKQLFNLIKKHNINTTYLVDSFGSLNNNKIKDIYKEFKENLKNVNLGIHLHNNMQNAFSNYELLKDENIIVDSTLYGMGRGAGNLNTELVLFNLGISTELKFELIEFILKYIKPIFKNNNLWGYELDFLLSGEFNVHPNYIVKLRDMNINLEIIINIIKNEIFNNSKLNFFDNEIFNKIIKENIIKEN